MTVKTITSPDASVATAVRRQVATLPHSYRWTDDPGAHILVIDGAAPTWVQQAKLAVSRQPQALMVHEPTMTGLDALKELAAVASDARVHVALLEGYPDNPALGDETLLQILPSGATGLGLATSTDSTGRRALLTLIRMLQSLGVADLSAVSSTGSERAIAATVQGQLRDSTTIVDLAAGYSPWQGAGCTLQFHSWNRSLEIDVAPPTTARPAIVRSTDSTGTLQLPQIFESGYRRKWRLVRADLDEESLRDDLASFHTACSIVQRLTNVHTGELA